MHASLRLCRRQALLLFLASASACEIYPAAYPCSGDENCPNGLLCQDAVCVAPEGVRPRDAGSSGIADAGVAAADGGGVVAVDAGADAGVVVVDAGADAGGVVVTDAGADAGGVVVTDAGVVVADAGMDAGLVVVDAGATDAGLVDAGPACTERVGNFDVESLGDLAAVDDPGAPCLRIIGDLQLRGDALTSLSSLANLIEITHNLFIHDTHNLVTLAGLGALARVGFDFRIENNDGIDTVLRDDFAALDAIGHDLRLINNPNLDGCSVEEFVEHFTEGTGTVGNNVLVSGNAPEPDGGC